MTNSRHDLECQIEGFGINVGGKGATKGYGVGEAEWGWQGQGHEAGEPSPFGYTSDSLLASGVL